MRLAWLLVITLAVTALASCAADGGGEGTTSLSLTSSSAAPPTTAAPASTTSTTAAPVPSTSTTARPATTLPAQPSVPGREYSRLPVGESKLVAFTFDAAYDPAPLEDILAALAEAGINATFFLTGEFAEDFPDSVAAIVAAGHPVGNHSYSHPDFTELGVDETRRQLRRTADLLIAAGAQDPRPLFRPPFGARNENVLARLGDEGYVSVYWTVDTLDWKPERTPEEVRRAVLDGLRPGAIFLMHVGSRQTAQILPTLIREVRERGYGFVTVPEALPAG